MSENQEVEKYDPAKEVARGGSAAKALLEVVKKAGLARKFGGQKEHLFYEAWQTLAKFHQCSVKTHDAVFVEIDGVKGAKAYADIIDDITGVVIGGAEAYCMRDELNWKNKPWFQLASMAQTRAGSKACRNKWAYIPALVGFATTPAEEMDEVHESLNKPEPSKQPPIETTPQPQIGLAMANPNQVKAINTILAKMGISDAYMRHEKVCVKLGLPSNPPIESLNMLTKVQASNAIEGLQKELGM